MNCSRCTSPNPPGAQFCLQCGSRFAEAVLAPPTPSQSIQKRPIPWVLKIILGALVAFVALLWIGGILLTMRSPKSQVNSAQSMAVVPISSPINVTSSKRLEYAINLSKEAYDQDKYQGAIDHLSWISTKDPEYPEAVKLKAKLMNRLNQERNNPEPIRARLKDSYELMISAAKPNYNFIKVSVSKSKGGYTLWASHAYFSQFSFDLGGFAGQVQGWIGQNREDLVKAGIRRVGVRGDGGYSTSTWFNVPE
jgi:hypothetical protein